MDDALPIEDDGSAVKTLSMSAPPREEMCRTAHYLLILEDGVSPDMEGPFSDDTERLERARAVYADNNEHILVRLDVRNAVPTSLLSVAMSLNNVGHRISSPLVGIAFRA